MFNGRWGSVLLSVSFCLWDLTARGQELPAIALTDDVAAVARIDLKSLDLPMARAAAAAAFEQPELTLTPLLVNREIRRVALIAQGVDSILITIPGPATKPERRDKAGAIENPQRPLGDRTLVLCHARGPHSDEQADKIAMITARYSAGISKWVWQGDWLVIHNKEITVDPHPAPGANAKQFAAALTFMGTRPGIAMVPNPLLRAFFAAPTKRAKGAVPASYLKTVERCLAAEWIVLAATINEKPSLTIAFQMPNESQAVQLAAEVGELQNDSKSWTRPNFDSGYVPPGDRILKLIGSCQVKQSKTRAGLLLNARQLGQLIDLAYVQIFYAAFDLSIDPDHPWRSLLPLSFWLENYEILYQRFPDTLEDLRPLLGANEAEQNEHLRRLLTNSVTGEYPSVAYTKLPRAVPCETKDPIMLRELKDGVPRHEGAVVRRSGWTDVGKEATVEVFDSAAPPE